MEYLKIGFIRKPHGLKGEIKILPLTNNVERYKKSLTTYLLLDNKYIKCEIETVKKCGDSLIIKFKNFNTIEEVESLRSVYVYVDRKDGEPLDSDEYYTQDLIGCNFYYNNENVGEVVDVYHSPSCDIFVLNYKNREILYPFLKIYIDSVDVKNKTISINQYEGFFD